MLVVRLDRWVRLALLERQGLLDYVDFQALLVSKVSKVILVFREPLVQLALPATRVTWAPLDYQDRRVSLDQLDLRDIRELLDSLAVQERQA